MTVFFVRTRSHRLLSTTLLVLSLGTTFVALEPSTLCAQDPRTPTNVCVVRSMGQTIAGNARVTNDPTLFEDPGAIFMGTDGTLLTTSPAGGRNNGGKVFGITTAGEIRVSNDFLGANGAYPHSGLVDGRDGYLYGTTNGGGVFGAGTLFRVRRDGSGHELLYMFRNANVSGLVPPPCPTSPRCPLTPLQRLSAFAAYPKTAPVSDGSGVLYGVTPISNYAEYGMLYRFSPPYDNDSFVALCIFQPPLLKDPVYSGFVCDPQATMPTSLVLGTDGELYGTTSGGNGSVFKAGRDGSISILHTFDGAAGGKLPNSVMQSSEGELYGTTYLGGSGGAGILFRIGTDGSAFEVLHDFTRLPGNLTSLGQAPLKIDGRSPIATLSEGHGAGGDSTGWLYGTTRLGGLFGLGTLFRIRLNGDDFSVLHDFDGLTGIRPETSPVLHPDGSLYGFTYQGGEFRGGLLYRAVLGRDHKEVRISNVVLRPSAARGRESRVYDDGPVHVQTHVRAEQPQAVVDDGITIRVGCTSPHVVQFIYRDILTSDNRPLDGEVRKDYPLRQWRTDATGKPNPYYDQGPGNARVLSPASGTMQLTTFDMPTFGEKTADGTPTIYGQPGAQDRGKSQRWSAIVKAYAMCNCELVREINYTREKFEGVEDYKNVTIEPVTAADLDWVKKQLELDGFDPLP